MTPMDPNDLERQATELELEVQKWIDTLEDGVRTRPQSSPQQHISWKPSHPDMETHGWFCSLMRACYAAGRGILEDKPWAICSMTAAAGKLRTKAARLRTALEKE